MGGGYKMKQEVPQGWLILKTDDLEDAIKECFEEGDPGCFLTHQKELCEAGQKVSTFCRLCKVMTEEIESRLEENK